MEYTAGELCAGICGIGLGFQNAGFKILLAAEMDTHACYISLIFLLQFVLLFFIDFYPISNIFVMAFLFNWLVSHKSNAELGLFSKPDLSFF